jgi:hypothetical protein
VVVGVGQTVELPMTLAIGTLTETVNVKAPSPMVDTRQTGTATNVTIDELTNIPTSRDPFSLLRTVNGVLVDRVNVGGNETGQQSNFVSKGTRPQDAVWTMDGVAITDMTLTGSSPTYFNWDNFEAVHVATAGQAITQQTGGPGLDFIVKRGTNLFHGSAHSYFDNDATEASNVPAELAAAGVTPATADHTDRISDYGVEAGGPLVRDKAWFYGSYSLQDVQLVRRAGALVDETKLKNPDVKLNWQATKKDMVSFLYFDGFKIKDGRSPGISGILFDAPGATYHQDNAYSDNPFHGLWKIADDRVFGPNLFISGKFAYFNTGFILDPEGGLAEQAGRSFTTAQSFGSVNQSTNVRPQHVINLDGNAFLTGMGASHDVKFGVGYRTAEAVSAQVYPGNMILAIENSPTDLRAQVYRQAFGSNKAYYTDFYVGDTISKSRMTIDAGLRYDQQWGKALASQTLANTAFPNVVPGLSFAGYDTPFTWKDFSPRAGITYALDESRKTVARASFSRYAGQLETGTVGVTNPSTTIGSATYRWVDLNSDHFAQANEVQLNNFITAAGGFNPASPTSVVSANVLDPNLAAPRTNSFVAGVEREVLPNLALQANYSYTKTDDLFGNFTGRITPRVGVTLADYAPGSGFSGTLPDGTAYNVPTFIPNAAKVAAGGNGFTTTNIPGYSTDFNGLELGLVKRLSNKWMSRVSFAWNNARDHFDSAAGVYDTNGNPTPTLSEPLKNGGQFAPQSGGSGSGSIYINAKWQFNANALYQAPYGIDVSGNIFGRQGYPNPLFRQGTTAALGGDSTLSVLVTPQIDSIRYDNLWNTDLRASRTFKIDTVSIRAVLDCFNVFNANTGLVRNNNIASPTFNTLAQNLSPRIFRVGLVVGF